MSVSTLRVPSTVTVVVVICWRVTTIHVKVMSENLCIGRGKNSGTVLHYYIDQSLSTGTNSSFHYSTDMAHALPYSDKCTNFSIFHD